MSAPFPQIYGAKKRAVVNKVTGLSPQLRDGGEDRVVLGKRKSQGDR